MEIKQSSIWTFNCPFPGGQILAFNIAAPSQAEAAQIFKDWLGQAQKELALLFPVVAPVAQAIPSVETPTTLNALQMGLIEDMVSNIQRPRKENIFETVKDWTGLELNVANAREIFTKLEMMKTNPVPQTLQGQPKPPKEKK